jgi:hypothetical protein
LPLTNTVKELEEKLDFGIQKLIKSEPGINSDRKMRQMRWIGVVGDADALGPGVFGVGLGATIERKLFFHKN